MGKKEKIEKKRETKRKMRKTRKTRKPKNKCLILLLPMLLLFASSTFGQAIDKLPLRIGVKLGFNIANVSSFETETDSRTGYVMGMMVISEQSPLLSYQVELLITGKGFEYQTTGVWNNAGNETPIPVLLKRKITYLEMPIMGRLRMPASGKYRPFVLVGGFFGLRMKETVHLMIGLDELEVDDKQAKKSEMGAIIGAGLDIKAGKSSLIFETRYEISMTKAVINSDSKSKLLSFQIGYLW